MATDLKLDTPLGVPPAVDPGAPPAPADQAKPAAPTDLAGWYRSEMDTLIPKFEAANKAAQESIARRSTDLAGVRERVVTAPGLPESPELPAPPPAPKITARPFLASVPGEDAVTSLNKAMAGFGLMAQMAVGIRGGFPQGALAAYTGALEGWQAGDQRRAANQWQTYMGELKQHERDVAAIRMKYDDAVRKWGGDQDRLKTELGILAAEHGLGREAIALSFQEPERALANLNTTAKLLGDMQASAANLALKNAMWLDDRSMKLAKMAQDAAEHQAAQALKAKEFEQKERFHADTLQAQRERATEKPISGPVAERAAALQEAMTSRDQINALRADPKIKAELDAWIGPVASRRRLGSWIPGGAYQPPAAVVKMDQALANLRNTALKARSGGAVTEPEQKRFDIEFPNVAEPPEMFWKKYDAIERNVAQNAETFRATAMPNQPASVMQPVNPQAQAPAPSAGWGPVQVLP